MTVNSAFIDNNKNHVECFLKGDESITSTVNIMVQQLDSESKQN